MPSKGIKGEFKSLGEKLCADTQHEIDLNQINDIELAYTSNDYISEQVVYAIDELVTRGANIEVIQERNQPDFNCAISQHELAFDTGRTIRIKITGVGAAARL